MKHILTLIILSAGIVLADPPKAVVVKHANVNRAVNTNIISNNSASSANVTSITEAPVDISGLVAWRKYQDERHQRTKIGSPLSPLDSQAIKPRRVTAEPVNSKDRYDAFLRDKGINPSTIGNATVADGRMVVPTIEEQYAARNASIAARLAAAAAPVTEEAIVSR